MNSLLNRVALIINAELDVECERDKRLCVLYSKICIIYGRLNKLQNLLGTVVNTCSSIKDSSSLISTMQQDLESRLAHAEMDYLDECVLKCSMASVKKVVRTYLGKQMRLTEDDVQAVLQSIHCDLDRYVRVWSSNNVIFADLVLRPSYTLYGKRIEIVKKLRDIFFYSTELFSIHGNRPMNFKTREYASSELFYSKAQYLFELSSILKNEEYVSPQSVRLITSYVL